MKKIEAIIRPEKFETVLRALEQENFISMNVTDVRGRGRQKGMRLMWRGSEYTMEIIPKTKIEMVVQDGDVEKVVKIIKKMPTLEKLEIVRYS